MKIYDELQYLRKRNAFLEKELRRVQRESDRNLVRWIAAQDLAYHRQVLSLLGVSPVDAPNGQPTDR